MQNLSNKAEFRDIINELLTGIVNEIEEEEKSYNPKNRVWGMSKLDPDFLWDHEKEGINKFEIKYGVGIDDIEYRQEAYNYIYFSEVVPNLKGNTIELKNQILDILDIGNIKKTIDFLENRISDFYEFKKGDFGRAYVDNNYTSIGYDNSHRFDVIWFYDERNRESMNIGRCHFSEYPFYGIAIQKWIDFEKAYRLIPVLKGCLGLMINDTGDIKKYNSKYSIDNVINKVNRFPELFLSAKECEFFFYVVQILPIKNKVDWTYIHLIFKHHNFFRERASIKDYTHLVSKVFSNDLNTLRKDTANTKFNEWEPLVRKNFPIFDNLINNSNNKP